MRNTKIHNKTPVELFAKSNKIPWNYMKNTQNSTGIMLKLIKTWRGLHDICLHFRPEPKILDIFQGNHP